MASLQFQLSVSADPGEATGNDWSTWVPAAHVEALDGVPSLSSGLRQPGCLGHVGNTTANGRSLAVCLCVSFPQK